MSKVFNIVMQGGGSAAELAVNTTWSELKAMRDNSQLSVGCLYRITDYETIISGEDVQSAGHVFDIIVLATDVNQLSEDAMAVHSERDTEGYFANSKLEAWELKYCIDNDTTRFLWANEMGKGVIYKMIDEHNNSCCYDFKNVQFKRYKITATKENPSEEEFYYYNKYAGVDKQGVFQYFRLLEGYAIDKNDSKYFYTFSYIDANNNINDTSMGIDLSDLGFGKANTCNDNVITASYTEEMIFTLNDNVFVAFFYSPDDLRNVLIASNKFEPNCQGNTIFNWCEKNYFDTYCFVNLLLNVDSCTFGKGFHFNKSCNGEMGQSSFGADCYSNTFLLGCYRSFVKNNVYINKFKGLDSCTIGSSVGNMEILNLLSSSTISDGVEDCNIGDGGDGNLKNCQILSGIDGETINFITDANYTQIAGLDSQGNLKVWNPADLVQA